MENSPEIKTEEKAFTQEVKPKAKSNLLPVLVILQTFVILVLAGLLIYQNRSSIPFLAQFASESGEDSNTDTQVEEDVQPDTTTPTLSAYTGTYISGELPENWSIVEYTDNTGSNMLMGGTTYSGLVGLKIFNENDTEMFHIKAVDGIGGTEGCDTVYEFSDSDQAYIEHGNDWTLETGIVPTTVVDLTDSTYTEYELLGKEVRRVDSELYRNINPNLPGFNPACGIDVHLTITNLAYYRQTTAGTTSGNTYYMAISDTVDTTQLELLDAVLESLTVN